MASSILIKCPKCKNDQFEEVINGEQLNCPMCRCTFTYNSSEQEELLTAINEMNRLIPTNVADTISNDRIWRKQLFGDYDYDNNEPKGKKRIIGNFIQGINNYNNWIGQHGTLIIPIDDVLPKNFSHDCISQSNQFQRLAEESYALRSIPIATSQKIDCHAVVYKSMRNYYHLFGMSNMAEGFINRRDSQLSIERYETARECFIKSKENNNTLFSIIDEFSPKDTNKDYVKGEHEEISRDNVNNYNDYMDGCISACDAILSFPHDEERGLAYARSSIHSIEKSNQKNAEKDITQIHTFSNAKPEYVNELNSNVKEFNKIIPRFETLNDEAVNTYTETKKSNENEKVNIKKRYDQEISSVSEVFDMELQQMKKKTMYMIIAVMAISIVLMAVWIWFLLMPYYDWLIGIAILIFIVMVLFELFFLEEFYWEANAIVFIAIIFGTLALGIFIAFKGYEAISDRVESKEFECHNKINRLESSMSDEIDDCQYTITSTYNEMRDKLVRAHSESVDTGKAHLKSLKHLSNKLADLYLWIRKPSEFVEYDAFKQVLNDFEQSDPTARLAEAA